MPDLATNVLYYGDNLDILRRYLPDAAVDLVYLDPPFNSNRDYNVIFRDESGNATDAQLLAFEDTWHWGPSAEATYAYLTNTARHEGRVPDKVSTIIAALRAGIVIPIPLWRASLANCSGGEIRGWWRDPSRMATFLPAVRRANMPCKWLVSRITRTRCGGPPMGPIGTVPTTRGFTLKSFQNRQTSSTQMPSRSRSLAASSVI